MSAMNNTNEAELARIYNQTNNKNVFFILYFLLDEQCIGSAKQ